MIQRRRPVPFELGPVHFIGIGGIGMSGIAEIMIRIGYTVQGSDAKASANTERLEKLGARIFIGQDAANVDGASAIVYSTAIKADNVEMAAGRDKRLPLVRRAEMLAELMRLQFSVAVGGTHGKTTTTSMVAALLDAGALDPTVVNGGIINAYGTNAKVGEGDWIVVEADESDGSFLKLKSTVAIVTNIDAEHLDHWGDFDAVKKGFQDFIEMGPEGAKFDILVSPLAGEPIRYDGLKMPMAGHHNVLNATAAVAVARELGVDADAIRAGLAGFGGVKRRFTTTGVANGIRVVDDYGHHPVEIAAVLKAARAVSTGKVIAVVQPHRYTRLRDLMTEFSSCFNDADTVIVADVYTAGEQPIEGVDRDHLVEGLKKFGHRRALALESPAALPALVAAEAQSGDLVVLLGAGDITNWSYALPGQLEALAK
jgi:UDP-N-acetylmuramate--alanine ligase